MTDKEIIQALECCSNASWSSCYDCPYREKQFKNHCAFTMSGDALDLINRQQAEIERLNEAKNILKETLEYKTKTIESQTIVVRALNFYNDKIRAEAIKKFAERLKKKAWHGMWETINHVDVDEIDNLVKKMVGEDK